MDPRKPGEVEATGTLPVAGEGTLPLQAPSRRPRSGAARLGRGGAREPRPCPASTSPTRTPAGRVVAPVSREWTRIGRSLAADVRFDDATVSRRHALIVRQADGVRVLDDRSLNGVYVNGQRVEWSALTDGDEILVGRHTIRFLDTPPAARPAPARGRRRRVAGRQRSGRYLLAASMAETIAVLSLKGGTGKTTTVRTLADVFRRIGLDVLAVDLDPQGNLSDYFDVAAGRDADDRRRPRRATPRPKAAVHDGIIPATPILAEAERALAGKMGRELVLRKALKDVAQEPRRHPDRLPAGARPAHRQRRSSPPTRR